MRWCRSCRCLCTCSGLALDLSFAASTRGHIVARAAITSLSSNGQTEGQITRLKLGRRQMYGCWTIDTLQARLRSCTKIAAEPILQAESHAEATRDLFAYI